MALSAAMQVVLAAAAQSARERSPPPAPDDLPGWQAQQWKVEGRALPACVKAVADSGVRLDTRQFADMPVLCITPPNAADRPPVIYIHGGGYVSFSAHSSLFASAPLACALARPLWSLDYPLAPHARFDHTVPATAAALTAIVDAEGPTAIIGDSAGGGLALAAVRHLDARRMAAIRAMVFLSPWVELSNAAHSHRQMAARDPILSYEHGLRAAAAAYTAGDIGHVMASPLRGDFARNYPPCLIIGGSEEILRTDMEHLATALGPVAQLDIHEGLFHSFPVLAPHAPESIAAQRRIRDFLDQHHAPQAAGHNGNAR